MSPAAGGAVVVACPNLALDRTIAVPRLVPGMVHRAVRQAAVGGGKGVNVARALGALGVPAVLVTLAAGPTGRAALKLLRGEGLAVRSVELQGDTRSCLTVLEDGRATVFNEEGPHLEAHGWEAFVSSVTAEARGARLFVCSGSFPPGAPPDAAAALARITTDAGATAICDVSGPQLSHAVGEGRCVVTPNLAEAEAVLLGRRDEPVEPGRDALARAAWCAGELVAAGAAAAVVTAGTAGAAFADGRRSGTVRAPRVTAVNPVGAGDSLVAGLASVLLEGGSLPDAVQAGVAAASASCETFIAGALDAARARRLLYAVFAAQARGDRGPPSA